jgi:hypothetical protein
VPCSLEKDLFGEPSSLEFTAGTKRLAEESALSPSGMDRSGVLEGPAGVGSNE